MSISKEKPKDLEERISRIEIPANLHEFLQADNGIRQQGVLVGIRQEDKLIISYGKFLSASRDAGEFLAVVSNADNYLSEMRSLLPGLDLIMVPFYTYSTERQEHMFGSFEAFVKSHSYGCLDVFNVSSFAMPYALFIDQEGEYAALQVRTENDMKAIKSLDVIKTGKQNKLSTDIKQAYNQANSTLIDPNHPKYQIMYPGYPLPKGLKPFIRQLV